MVVVVIVLYILGTLPPQEHSPEIFAAAKATVPIVPALASETLSSSSFSYLTEITFGCGNIYYGMAMWIYIPLVSWLETTVTSTSRYLPCVRELQSTPCQRERHGVRKGGERGKEQRRERWGKAGGGGTGPGTAKGDELLNREGSGSRSKKWVRWWRMCRSTGIPTRRKVPIRFGTYNNRNDRNGGL